MVPRTRTPGAVPATPDGGAPAALVILFCLGWSSAFAVGKIGIQSCPPLLFLSLRFLLAGGALCLAAAVLGQLRGLGLRGWTVLALLGVLNNSLYLGLTFAALETVSSGLVTLIVSANPVLTAAAATLVLGEAMSARKTLGLVLGMAGVAFVVRGRLGGGDDPTGIALALGAAVAMVAGTLLFKRLAPRVPVVPAGGVQILAGGLALLPVGLALEDPELLTVDTPFLLSLGYMAFVVSVGAHLLWFLLLQRSTATAASAYHFLMPPLGLAFGWLLLGEAAQPWDLAGIVPVALGIWLVTRAPTAALTPAPARG
ncbi:MAG TPA: DMT family transporter [Azospirillum sp.]|nr:DMT family transporter [Azospirillum sp.]